MNLFKIFVQITRFCEQMSGSLKNTERFAYLLISGEWPERFAHSRSFLVSDLSELFTSLIFIERPEWLTEKERFAWTAGQRKGKIWDY